MVAPFSRPAWIAALLLVLLFSAPESRAQHRPIELDEIISVVLAENPSLRAAGLNADALATRGAQVSALPDPTISAMYGVVPMMMGVGVVRSALQVEQMIPFPGKRGLRGDVADLGADVAFHETRALAEVLVLRTKKAYYDLYRIQQLEGLIRSFQDELRGFEEIAAVRYEVGEGMQDAVLRAQIERNRFLQQLIDLQVERRAAAETLARLTNRPAGARFYQTVELTTPPVPVVDAEALLAVAAQRRAEMAALDAAALQADRQVELAHREFRPDFGVMARFTDVGRGDAPGPVRNAFEIGASIKIPLQRGRLRSQLEEAEVRRREIDARREALQTEFATEIEELLHRLEQERNTLELYEHTLLPQATSTVEAALNAYVTGRTDFLNLLDAERTVFSLEIGYEDTRRRYLQATAELERALGIRSLGELERLLAGPDVKALSPDQSPANAAAAENRARESRLVDRIEAAENTMRPDEARAVRASETENAR